MIELEISVWNICKFHAGDPNFSLSSALRKSNKTYAHLLPRRFSFSFLFSHQTPLCLFLMATMKLRIRSLESKQTLKIEISTSSTLQQFKQTLSHSILSFPFFSLKVKTVSVNYQKINLHSDRNQVYVVIGSCWNILAPKWVGCVTGHGSPRLYKWVRAVLSIYKLCRVQVGRFNTFS